MLVQTDDTNHVFKLAAGFVNNTSRHIFLTGKAGTGKTTFLKYIKAHTTKRAVVVAPTGVAAINAAGVTMHSFFQLPFGPFIPTTSQGFGISSDDVTDKNSLFKNIRFNAEKRVLLEELELLIIDEVSMVRADMLDAMDAILRHFRRRLHIPFGGVQVLYIGDMYQLPPVVPGNEWDILKSYYESPFFFSAHVIAQAPPLYIELKKIYRQNEQSFIDVLNRVRNNEVTDNDFNLLNELYQPGFNPPASEQYITLCTHNKKADAINTEQINKLPGTMHTFTGVIDGEFSDKALPTEMNLQLKTGAQVMFIKNDSGAERKYFNGKLATITSISNEEIAVITNDTGQELKIEKETWRNIRYNFNKEANAIEEEELGSFTQYPLRLAWAVTIHKSQGLTFNKAIIDAGASFAAGQVYVALSRCTSLQGIVLLSKLHPSAITTDSKVIAFAQKEAAAEELQQLLQQEERRYKANELVKIFDYSKILAAIESLAELIPGKKLPDIKAALSLSNSLLEKATAHNNVAGKFQLQLQQLLQQFMETGNISMLEERIIKGIDYLVKATGEDLLIPLQKHHASLQHASKVKKYTAEVAAIVSLLQQHAHKMTLAAYDDFLFCKNPEAYKAYTGTNDLPANNDDVYSHNHKIKGSSQSESLHLFKKGKTVAEIAAMRQLTEGTIQAHLAMYIRTGELTVLELLTEEKLNAILPVVMEVNGVTISPIKEILGDTFSYADIRIVLNHWQRLQEDKVNA